MQQANAAITKYECGEIPNGVFITVYPDQKVAWVSSGQEINKDPHDQTHWYRDHKPGFGGVSLDYVRISPNIVDIGSANATTGKTIISYVIDLRDHTMTQKVYTMRGLQPLRTETCTQQTLKPGEGPSPAR
jgi:hypothetical protein